MKSKLEQLESRGYLEKINLDSYILSINEKLELIKNKIPKNRTLGARLLKSEVANEEIIEKLIEALKIEKKLYCKIEISELLTSYGELSVKYLLKVIAKIGSNQHKSLPLNEFKKNNYPLPRDIVARILAHIGKAALSEILVIFKSFSLKELSEIIDVIGFVCFYDYQKDIYEVLKECYEEYTQNDLIKWKIIRAFSAFPESKGFLELEYAKLTNESLKLEVNRSLSLINKKL